jgi:hypothetical protein
VHTVREQAADLRFMVADASDDDLLAATALNHLDWMKRLAIASRGIAEEEDGVHWTYTSRAEREVSAAVVDQPGPGVRAQLGRLLEMCRREQVDRVGYWAFSDGYRSPLGGWLAARGFRWGNRPHWMSLDLRSVPSLPSLAELTAATGIMLTDRFVPQEGSQLPCYEPDTAPVREAMAAQLPRRVWHPILMSEGRPAGQVSVCATSGDLGVFGCHDLIVVAPDRVRGLALSRIQWLCRFAIDLGSRYLVTNAADQTAALYRVAGLRTLGFGQTWWLPGHALHDDPPPAKAAFAEAIGAGDLDALDSLAADLTRAELDAPLPNGMTPLQLAGATGHTDSAAWLVDRGAHLDVLGAWDLGWKDEAWRLLRDNPGLVDQRRPRSGKTLLHVAAERDDVDLAELLLRAGIDTTVTDSRFGGTALDWTRELGRPRVAAAIRRQHTRAPDHRIN